jgi:CCR4-NOT transcriptional regulation complex NOT5 subunit
VSLEQAISDNTAAVKELIGVWAKLLQQGKNINTKVAAGEIATVTAGDVEIAVATPKPAAVAATPTATVTATPAATVPDEAVVVSPSEVTYAEVSAAVILKMKTDRAAVMSAAAKFGVKNAKELKPEQWAKFIEAIA